MRAFSSALVACAWLACVTPSCAATDVTLATLPVGDDAGSTPVRCGTISDCPAGSYCEKPSCDAPSGTCTFFPSVCVTEERPECGCDGITYFDDCLRRQSGIASFTAGPCWQGNASTCGGPASTSCPEGAVCALLLGRAPGPCQPDAEGSCWVVPLQCPASMPGDDRWDSCQPGLRCADTCTALQAGGPFLRSMTCH